MQSSTIFKNHGVGQLLVSQTPQAPLVPYWVGTQPLHGEPLGQLKSVTGDHINVEEQLPVVSRRVNRFVVAGLGPGLGFEIPEKGGNSTANCSNFPGNVLPCHFQKLALFQAKLLICGPGIRLVVHDFL